MALGPWLWVNRCSVAIPGRPVQAVGKPGVGVCEHLRCKGMASVVLAIGEHDTSFVQGGARTVGPVYWQLCVLPAVLEEHRQAAGFAGWGSPGQHLWRDAPSTGNYASQQARNAQGKGQTENCSLTETEEVDARGMGVVGKDRLTDEV